MEPCTNGSTVHGIDDLVDILVEEPVINGGFSLMALLWAELESGLSRQNKFWPLEVANNVPLPDNVIVSRARPLFDYA